MTVPSRRPPARPHLWMLAASLLVAGCASSDALSASRPSPSATESSPQWPPWPQGVQTYDISSADHRDADIDYELTPPAGGDHASVWQNCGVYDEPVADENAVHSLEHGAVWLTYAPDLPADEIEQLRALVGGSSHVLLSPHPEQQAPVVATAWSVQLQVQEAGDPRIQRFLGEFVQGPQTPEPGAPCSGGVGRP